MPCGFPVRHVGAHDSRYHVLQQHHTSSLTVVAVLIRPPILQGQVWLTAGHLSMPAFSPRAGLAYANDKTAGKCWQRS